MVTAVAAVLESPSPSRQRHRLAVASGAAVGGTGDFELPHWRHGAGKRASSGMRGRWAPPEIEIPNGGGPGGGYTSLRDILSSPEYAAAAAKSKASSPGVGEGGGGGDVHMIRHPLVKHAAYAYLQLTPSWREDEAWRRRCRRRGPLRRLLAGCLGFLGALFRR